MNKRQIVKLALEHREVPYTPWAFGFTSDAADKLREHYKTDDLTSIIQNHILGLDGDGFFKSIGDGREQDIFGVIWDRSNDKDTGIVENILLPEAKLTGYDFPDPDNPNFYNGMTKKIRANDDLYRIYNIGFSLFERAWTLRGMENLLMDFHDNPDFVKKLFRVIADHNIERVKMALKHDIDAVFFGDDWGQQHGLIMGPKIWREFIKPELKRMYGAVKDAGKKVFIHSCGDVDELFDDLIEIGLDCFNPFQPEVMDIYELMERYHGKLAFNGGLSTQQLLPYGTVEEVVSETRKLLKVGRNGGYIFAPAHAVQGDVPLENMLAFIDITLEQLKE